MKFYIKKTFEIMMKNSAMLEVFLFCIMALILLLMFFSTRALSNIFFVFGFMFLLSLLSFAFLSGWLNVIKYGVDNYPNVDKTNPNDFPKIMNYNKGSYKSFFPGVSEYFLPLFGLYLVFYIVMQGISYSFNFIYPNYINILNTALSNFATDKDIIAFQQTLSAGKMPLIIFLSAVISIIFSFLFIYSLPVFYYNTKNPFKTIGITIKFIFKNFFSTVFLYLSINIIMFFILILNSIFNSSILVFIPLFMGVYFITYSITLIFLFYRQTTLKEIVEKVNSQDVFIKSSEVKNEEE